MAGTVPEPLSKTCGRCLVDFPGLDGALLAFCKQDRFFVCGRCVKECRRIHGTSPKVMGFPAVVPGLSILFLFACVAPSALPLAYEYTTLNAWYAMAVTPLQAASPSQTIKIAGTISSESGYVYPVALSGRELIGRGCTWSWDEGAQFTVSDGTGVILVTVSRYWEIADAPHPNPYRTCNIPESEYLVGDAVAIMGTVQSSPSQPRFLQAFIVSPDSSHPLPNLLGWLVVTPFLVLCIGLWVRTAIVGRRRLALHRASLEGKASMPLPASPDMKDPGLPWQPTYKGSVLLDQGRYVAVFAAVPMTLPLAYWVLANAHSQNGYYIAALFGTAGAFFSVTVLFMATASRVKPSAIAVTQAGIHFWYERPADRYELDDLLPWSDVTGVRVGAVGRTQALFLDLSSGDKRSFPGLDRGVQDAILNGWRDRSGLPDAPGFR